MTPPPFYLVDVNDMCYFSVSNELIELFRHLSHL